MKQFRFWLLVTLALGCFVPSACNKPAASDDKPVDIADLSMGGFGTLYYALSYPQKFTYAYAMSPAVSMIWFVSLDQMKEKAAALTDVNPHPDFTIEVGNQDTMVSNADAKELSDAINQAAHCEWIARDGIHYWDFWQQCLPKALKKAGESFTK